ncbi:unnamed protein product [Vicia faba]|uniref:Uncharacterized protein n=1 Tax=Vicia faba TaxID=3906 RepID=A0AAV0ZIY4_VICFA|nr:unnamed protein product [Vicia faba]
MLCFKTEKSGNDYESSYSSNFNTGNAFSYLSKSYLNFSSLLHCRNSFTQLEAASKDKVFHLQGVVGHGGSGLLFPKELVATFERRSELPLLLNFHRSPLVVIPGLGEDVNSDESLPRLLRSICQKEFSNITALLPRRLKTKNEARQLACLYLVRHCTPPKSTNLADNNIKLENKVLLAPVDYKAWALLQAW